VVRGSRGSILHTRTLTIGAQGRMQGDIRDGGSSWRGRSTGIFMPSKAWPCGPGRPFHGDVFAPRIAVDEGARRERSHRHGQRARGAHDQPACVRLDGASRARN